MGKLLKAQIKEEIIYLQVSCELFREELKRFHKGTRRTDDLPYTDQSIFKESKARWKNVAMM